MNRVLTAAAGVAAVIAGVVGLWALAGVVAVMVYRAGQMAEHGCLAALPVPAGNVTVGVVAVSLAAALAVLLALRAPTERRRHVVWAFAAYLVVAVPLSVGAIALTAGGPPPGPSDPTACMNDLEESP